jgi:hypothetical protein
MFLTSRPSCPLIRGRDIPIGAALPRHGTQVLSQFVIGWPSNELVAVVYLEDDKPRLKTIVWGIMGLCVGSVYSAISRSF